MLTSKREIVRANLAEIAQAKKERMEAKLRKAEEKRKEMLDQRIKKAHEEDEKVGLKNKAGYTAQDAPSMRIYHLRK